MSERYTVEEIRAAVARAVKGTYVEAAQEKYTKRDVDAVIAELTRPATPPIHPSVAVMYKHVGGGGLCFGAPEGSENTVLIPAPLVMEWMKWWGSHPAGRGLCGYTAEKIAHYSEHGETDHANT